MDGMDRNDSDDVLKIIADRTNNISNSHHLQCAEDGSLLSLFDTVCRV